MVGLNSTVDLIALSVALWLGVYLVTRSRRPTAWLAAGASWSLVGYFLNRLINLNFIGYPELTLLGGWSAILVAPLWYHLSTEFYPSAPARRWLVPLGYLVSLIFLGLMVATDLIFRGPSVVPATTGAAAGAGPLYASLGGFLTAYGLLALWNLGQARRNGPRLYQAQITAILWATAIAVIGSMYLIIIDLFSLAAPLLVGDILLAVAIGVLGYGVARYNALLDGRPTGRDLGYMAAVIALIVGVYVLFIGLFFQAYAIPLAALVPVVMLVIVSHTLYDGFRSRLDHLFYRESSANLRDSLRALAREAGTTGVESALRGALTAACADLGADRGLVALRHDDGLRVAASLRASAPGRALAPFPLPDDAEALTTSMSALPDMAAIAPLAWGGATLGFIAVGPRAGGYTRGALGDLADVADRMAAAVHAAQEADTAAATLTSHVETMQARDRELQRQVQAMTELAPAAGSEPAPPREVEDALRHLYDFPYLGEHALAQLAAVTAAATGRADGLPTIIDRGQALRDVLLSHLERLRPAGREPQGDAAASRREWHAYLVLRQSYVDDIPTRETMSRLALSEGTYNRTRRQALHGVARSLADEERAHSARS